MKKKFLKISFIHENLSLIGFWKVTVTPFSFKILKFWILTSGHVSVFLFHHTSDPFLKAFSY